ncbi:MAG: RNA polymerase sigma factor [Bacteroidia bacterium]
MSFETLYETHKDLVFNLCLHYVPNREDATELTQEVFVKVHRHLPAFRGESGHKTWIYRIAIRTCLDFLRSRKRRQRWRVSLGGDSQPQVADFDHPGVQLEQQEALAAIFALIDALPERQKTALILSRLEHKIQREVAEIMGLHEKAVESLLHRARTRLREQLKQK